MDDLTVICIFQKCGTQNFVEYFSKLTDILNVKYVTTWECWYLVLTTDNIIYYDCPKTFKLKSFKFNKNVRLVASAGHTIFILYDDNGVDAYSIKENSLLEFIPKNNKLILDMHANSNFLLILYDDNNLTLKTDDEIFIELSAFNSTLTTLYETEDIIYTLICNSETKYIVTILKNIKIVSCNGFCESDAGNSAHLIYPSQNRSTLPFLDDRRKDYVLKILETGNCKYALFRDGACIVILQDNSFKIIDSGYYGYFREVDDIFPNLNDTYKTCELFTRGSYI